MFKQSKNFLSKKSKKFINEIVLAPGIFPYYQAHVHPYHNKAIKRQAQTSNQEDGRKFMSHIILARPDDNNYNKHRTPVWNSKYYIEFIDIINEFCEQQKIKIEKFYRMNVNFVYNTGYETTDIHTDHEFPYYQIIIYLDYAEDKNAETIIVNKKHKIIKRIKPIQYQGIFFDSKPHYIKFPKFGQRVTLIATFKKGR